MSPSVQQQVPSKPSIWLVAAIALGGVGAAVMLMGRDLQGSIVGTLTHIAALEPNPSGEHRQTKKQLAA